MKHLEELEKKVLQVISKNKELRDENSVLKTKNDDLKKRCDELQVKLSAKNQSSESLENERAGIKKSIEDLLVSISSLEKATKQEDVK